MQLIGSLTRAEKRHFRLMAKRNQNSEDILFLQLFDLLDKQKTYDEPYILNRLPNIKKRQLSNIKAHLYKQLLMSLRLLAKNQNVDIQVREQIDYAQVLYDKGLYRQALDVLNRTKIKAYKTKRFKLVQEIVEFEKLLEGQYVTQSIENRSEELANESSRISEMNTREYEFSNLSLRLYGFYLKFGYVKNEKDHLMVREFFQSKLPRYNVNELTFFEKLYLYQSHVWYYHMTQEFPLCYKYAQLWLELFHEAPEMMELEMPLYLKSMHNLLNSLFNLWQYDKFSEVLGELQSVPERFDLGQHKNTESLYHLYSYIHRIKQHYMQGTFAEGTTLVPELMKTIEEDRYNWDHHRVMVFYYRIACLYFGCGNNDETINYLNLIINEKTPNYRGDIQVFARILRLIAHYELGNVRLIEYQVKSVYRFMGKMEDLHAVQREIFKFLRKLPRIHEYELRDEFIQLRNRLERTKNLPYELRPYLYLDITSWLEAKINNTTVEAVIQDKFEKGIAPAEA